MAGTSKAVRLPTQGQAIARRGSNFPTEDQIRAQFPKENIRRKPFTNLCVSSKETQMNTGHLDASPIWALFTLPPETIYPFTAQIFVESLMCGRHCTADEEMKRE